MRIRSGVHCVHKVIVNIPNLILITGNMAAGKSSVAQVLAEQLPNSVHLRGDVFRRMIVNGQAKMEAELSATAQAQLLLRYQIATTTARQYIQAGFTVVFQDVIIGAALQMVLTMLEDVDLGLVVLCPDAATVQTRDHLRQKTAYPDQQTLLAFDHALRDQTPRLGLWLDSSELSIEETVAAILAHFTKIRS